MAPPNLHLQMGGPELQTVLAERSKDQTWKITSGVKGLTILKTRARPLRATSRIGLRRCRRLRSHLCTSATCNGSMPARLRTTPRSARASWPQCSDLCRPPQHERSAYAFRYGRRRIGGRSRDCARHLAMPNLHHLLADLSRFGRTIHHISCRSMSLTFHRSND